MTSLPPNIRLTTHPFFHSKLARLRDRSLPSSTVRTLVAELTQILAVEATALLEPLPAEKFSLIVILRSGLAMSDPFLAQLSPDVDVVVYHLGLFREKKTLEPVEYYNKLPIKDKRIRRAFIVDPLVATGGTAAAAIAILKDWGVEHVSFVAILSSKTGLERAAAVWPEGTSFYVGAVDDTLDAHGYVSPGVGDIGDRLFGTELS